MEGLANYGSDDECEESPRHDTPSGNSSESDVASTRMADCRVPNTVTKQPLKSNEVPYDGTGMDNSENEDHSSTSSPSRTPPMTKQEVKDKVHKVKNSKHERRRSRSRSLKRSRSGSSDRSSKRKDANRRHNNSRTDSKGPSNSRSRSKSRSMSRSPSNRRGRDDYKHRERDRDRHRRDKRRRSRSRDTRDSRGTRDSKSSKDNKETRDSRNSWKDTRDYRKDSRNYRDGKDSRELREFRSDGRDRYNKRFDRASNKLAHLEKMGIDLNLNQDSKIVTHESYNSLATVKVPNAILHTEESRLLPPGVTGRLREQMERRKALWQKKETVVDRPAAIAVPNTGKAWETTTFAHDQEGKQANKFKRLMGIKEGVASNSRPGNEMAKKQEELFCTMEQQYEVARTATHTMRGVGLGFGSYQR